MYKASIKIHVNLYMKHPLCWLAHDAIARAPRSRFIDSATRYTSYGVRLDTIEALRALFIKEIRLANCFHFPRVIFSAGIIQLDLTLRAAPGNRAKVRALSLLAA
jgi:hypothetical protein